MKTLTLELANIRGEPLEAVCYSDGTLAWRYPRYSTFMPGEPREVWHYVREVWHYVREEWLANDSPRKHLAPIIDAAFAALKEDATCEP